MIVMLLNSLYSAANTLTQMVGLNPIQVGIGIAALLFLLFIAQMVSALMGRTSFSIVDTYKGSVSGNSGE